MSGDPLAGLRRLLPVLFLIILVQAGFFVWAVWGGRAGAQPALRAVVAADLQGALSGAGPLTVFAPTNAAFAALLTELGVTKDQLLANKALLTSVLKYHVVNARVLKADVPVGAPVTTLEAGKTFTVNASLAITDAQARTSRITATDVFASNGVIHVIDKVLRP